MIILLKWMKENKCRMKDKIIFTNEDYLALDLFFESLDQGYPQTNETIRAGIYLCAKLECMKNEDLSVDEVMNVLYDTYLTMQEKPHSKVNYEFKSEVFKSHLESIRTYLYRIF